MKIESKALENVNELGQLLQDFVDLVREGDPCDIHCLAAVLRTRREESRDGRGPLFQTAVMKWLSGASEMYSEKAAAMGFLLRCVAHEDELVIEALGAKGVAALDQYDPAKNPALAAT